MVNQNGRGGARPGAGRKPTGNAKPLYAEKVETQDAEWLRERGGLKQILPDLRRPSDFRLHEGHAMFCNACREIRKYCIFVNLSDGHLDGHDYYICKPCLEGWLQLLPGDDVPSTPSTKRPEGL